MAGGTKTKKHFLKNTFAKKQKTTNKQKTFAKKQKDKN